MKNKIITGDCVEKMALLPDNSVDLVVTSPPYPGQKGNNMIVPEWLDWMTAVFDVMYPKLTDTAVVCLNVMFKRDNGWFNGGVFDVISLLGWADEGLREGLEMIDVYMWIKPNPPPNGPLRYCDVLAWEPVFVATKAKSKSYTFNRYYEPYKQKSKRGKKLYTTRSTEASLNSRGARQPNVIIASSSGDSRTNTPRSKGQSFPMALPLRMIEQFSNPGDWVLDPFCGVGRTCRAAQQLGRDWTGIEIDEGEAIRAREWLFMRPCGDW